MRTGSTRRYYPNYPCKWSTNTVCHILERRKYLEHTVHFKTEKVSYKMKVSVTNPIEKQVVFENTHEPIIDQPPHGNGCRSFVSTASGPTAMTRWACSPALCSAPTAAASCTAHFIRTDLLTAGVTANLRQITSYAAKHETQFVKMLLAQNEDGGKRKNVARKREIEAAERRITELKGIFKRLYEDSVNGHISDERFAELSADYEQEEAAWKARAAELQAEQEKAQEATVNVEKFMGLIRKYTNFEELPPTLLREFVEKILVHEATAEDGKRRGLFHDPQFE